MFKKKKKKFSKFFENQISPEWRKAYCDYNNLNTCLKTFKIIS